MLSRLAAGRLKDNELITALIHYKLVDVDTARARIAAVADLHMRAILHARLHPKLKEERHMVPGKWAEPRADTVRIRTRAPENLLDISGLFTTGRGRDMIGAPRAISPV